MMFGLHRNSSKEKQPRLSVSQTSFKYALNTFDEFFSVQEKPNRWSKEHVKRSKDESVPKWRLLDVQEFSKTFEKEMLKALKDVSKIKEKSTSPRAPVAEPSLFITEKAKGKSENSDFIPTFDESDEEPIETFMSCEQSYDLSYFEPEFITDNEQANVELTVLQPDLPSSLVLSPQVFEEEPLVYPHQCPCLDTWISLDDVPDPIFDVEDEPEPVFDEEATSIISTFMESHLCFDSGTTTAPSSPAILLPDLQEHCEKSDLVNSLPNMFVKISSYDVTRFGLDKMKDFCVSKSVFDNMINSFKIFEPENLLDQTHFQNVNDINSGIILSFDQFLEHNKGFHCLEKSLELDLQQTDFCATKSFDSFVCKANGFNLSSSKHELITGDLNSSSLALNEFMVEKLLENKSLENENNFCDLDLFDFILQPDLVCSGNDKTWHFLNSSRDHCVVLSLDDILVYNTFFEKPFESLINVSQSELKLVCSDFWKDVHVLKMSNIVAYFDKILVYNVYFDMHLDRLRLVLLVHENKILIFELNKYLSCTYDPGRLVSVLSIQERQFKPQKCDSIVDAHQPEIWRCISSRKSALNLQGSFCPYFAFFEFSLNFKSFVSYLFPFDTGTIDLRTNPFEEGEYNVSRSVDQNMEQAQHGVLNVMKISTEVHNFHCTGQTDRTLCWTVPHSSE